MTGDDCIVDIVVSDERRLRTMDFSIVILNEKVESYPNIQWQE